MVVGALADVAGALTTRGTDAFILPAAPGRIAVLPRENEYRHADAEGLARTLSARLHTDALSGRLFDTDVVSLDLYRDGESVSHRRWWWAWASTTTARPASA